MRLSPSTRMLRSVRTALKLETAAPTTKVLQSRLSLRESVLSASAKIADPLNLIRVPQSTRTKHPSVEATIVARRKAVPGPTPALTSTTPIKWIVTSRARLWSPRRGRSIRPRAASQARAPASQVPAAMLASRKT